MRANSCGEGVRTCTPNKLQQLGILKPPFTAMARACDIHSTEAPWISGAPFPVCKAMEWGGKEPKRQHTTSERGCEDNGRWPWKAAPGLHINQWLTCTPNLWQKKDPGCRVLGHFSLTETMDLGLAGGAVAHGIRGHAGTRGARRSSADVWSMLAQGHRRGSASASDLSNDTQRQQGKNTDAWRDDLFHPSTPVHPAACTAAVP